ncbi:MAG TPA: hypothetical protein VGD98_18965 [Ktedonobacteraceae bacterium]
MSKTKRRKKNRSRPAGGGVTSQVRVEQSGPASFPRRRRTTGGASLQRVVFALMLTLGFLGIAIFFTFFYAEDANHYLYGGAMGLTALGWLFLAGRRWSVYRQSAPA